MGNVMVAEAAQGLAGLSGQVRLDGGFLITIASHGLRPLADRRPTPVGTQPSLRPFGLAAGEFTLPDDFDAPLPDEIVDAFEGR